MRGRGLKLELTGAEDTKRLVAPHAGAWIETTWHKHSGTQFRVAPHAGAWIETSQARHSMAPGVVAPHAGAWIETK